LGRAHRFAGSGDRSAIGTLVYDTLAPPLHRSPRAWATKRRGRW